MFGLEADVRIPGEEYPIHNNVLQTRRVQGPYRDRIISQPNRHFRYHIAPVAYIAIAAMVCSLKSGVVRRWA